MQLTLLKAKLHQACVTDANLHYEGFCAIDTALLAAAGILQYEQIQIYNLANGERFTTYAMGAEAGSGVISMNGAAAYKAQPEDYVIICSYGLFSVVEASVHQPRVVYLDAFNQIKNIRSEIPIQHDAVES